MSSYQIHKKATAPSFFGASLGVPGLALLVLMNNNCLRKCPTRSRPSRVRRFPELRANPFYITGESYAGVYVPLTAQEILANAPEVRSCLAGLG